MSGDRHPRRYLPEPVPGDMAELAQAVSRTWSVVVPLGMCPDLAARQMLRTAFRTVEDQLGHAETVALAEAEVDHLRATPPEAPDEPF